MSSITSFALNFLFVFLLSFVIVSAQTESSAAKPVSPSTDDERAVKSLISEYFNSYPKKDVFALASFWSEKSPDFAARKQELEQVLAENEGIAVKDILFGKMEIAGNAAQVRLSLAIDAIEIKTKKSSQSFGSRNRFFNLVKEDGKWKIFHEFFAEKWLSRQLLNAKTEEERNRLLNENQELINTYLINEFYKESERLPGTIPYLRLLEVFNFGTRIAEKVSDPAMTSNFLNQIANVYSRENKPEKALEYLQKSYAIGEQIGNKQIMANALGRTGNFFNRRGDTIKALEYHLKALPLREEIGDADGLSIVLSNLGLVYASQTDFTRAIESFEKSVKLSESGGNKSGMAIDLYNLGNVYKLKGDYGNAMIFYQKSLNSSAEIGSPAGITAAVYINIADLMNSQGNYQQAQEYANKALGIFELMGEKYGISITLNVLGEAQYLQGQYLESIEFVEKAISLYQNLGDKLSAANGFRKIGENYLLLGNNAQATEYFRKAAETYESMPDQKAIAGGMVSVLISEAKLKLSEKKFSEAQKAVESAKSYFGKFSEMRERWELFIITGQINRQMNQLPQARQSFDKAIEIIEKQRSAITGTKEEEQRFFSDKISAYVSMVDLLISLNNPAEALVYAERAKSRALLDVLQNGTVSFTKAMSSTEKAQEQQLKSELISLNTQISKESEREQIDKNRLADLQNQLAKKRLEFEDFQNRLYAAHPELKIQRGELKPITLEESARLLPDDKSALLEYVVADDKIFLFVLSRQMNKPAVSIKVYPIDIKQKNLAERAESFRSKIANGDLDFAQEARDLYHLLLKPAEAEFKDKTNLIIVPDNVLWNLPFQALQNTQSKYLIESAALSYAPSLTTLREMRGKNKNNLASGTTLLAFGNPTVGKDTSEIVKKVFMSEKLNPLPEAERLVNSLKQLYGANKSKIFVGAEAREEIAKVESPKFQIIQFAAHGILNDISPMYSQIVLAQKQDNLNEDGLLEAWEMKDLNLNADLVILSACETARGRFTSGEGVIGMSWALFIAGAPATVASQWKVESSSTTELMLEFHRQLLSEKNISKAEALRRASFKLMKMPNYKHPSYWAGFVIVGDGF